MAGTVNNDRVKWLFLDVLLITFKIQKTIQKENIISFTFLLCSMFLWHQHSPQSSQSCWLNNQFQIHNHNCQQPNGKTKMIKKILPNQLQKPSCAEEHEKVESCSWSHTKQKFSTFSLTSSYLSTLSGCYATPSQHTLQQCYIFQNICPSFCLGRGPKKMCFPKTHHKATYRA